LKRLIPAALILLFAILACITPGLPTDTPPGTEPFVTEPPATEPLPTEGITSEPLVPTLPLPSGFVAAPDTNRIIFYTPDGSVTGSLSPGDLGYIGTQSFHVAGGTSAGIPPVVYFTWRDSVAQILQNIGGVETLLVSNSDFFRMGGAEGSPYFAYSTASYADPGLLTQLYIGTAATIGTVAPVVEITATDFQALKPVALRMESGMPTGVWYTGCMYGIGGDIVFDPCNHLTFLDLSTGVSSEVVGDGFNPSELSPDHTWVAYAPPGGGEPLTVRNLVTGENYTFPVWPENDRGSGDGIFSPDNNLVAWMEASGYRMDDPPTFRSMVRLATTDGALLGDFPMAFFTASAGFEVMWASPVAWLDNDSVIVQVSGVDWNNNAILRLDLPSSLIFLANGHFVGLIYP
jgi:hypothetical protein